MPRTHPTPDTATSARWRAAGRGSGEGATYQPWLTVHDVPSRGFSHRIDGWKTGRVHHFLSTWELAYFYYAEWSPMVIDIREQYPLFEVAETEAIARQCGIRSPHHPAAHTPLVMTTDFLVTFHLQGHPTLLARTIKPRTDLSKRTLEKFEIERRFWAARGVSWQIVTDQELSPIFTDNMHRLHAAYFPDPDWTPDLLAATTAVLTAALHASTNALATLALDGDRRLGQAPGTSLGIVYHLVATKRWEADLFTALDPARAFTLRDEGATPRLSGL